ncbi:AIR synthase related protein [Fluviispira sanaruensis]|uniref:Phosphoribosylformylglycinamidine synthase subunit PurL n=1 Tax=Fluviispira sanaruensis TaxID=2493639 RepID=A0A4P2VI35_FLUSA|nr:AIR synthase related protein [Fluviispira sanaruensis]BBH52723.1 phosphoribosylformylglycinamidine (FGAM) synthase [Fluviispira sanaruensis]
MSNKNLITAEYLEKAAKAGLNNEEATAFVEKLGRIPSTEELAVCGALWSEHCSYKSSRVHLKRFHTEEPWVLQGPGENAGVIAINKNYGIAFKMESHNHPSYLEPYQGAATGVGGILRDVFCMGAYPIAALNCLRFGEGTWNATLLRDTVRGIGDYGNCVGVPTVTGDISFHHNYNKNILVNAFTAGIIHKDKIFKGILSEASDEQIASLKKKTKEILPQIQINSNVTKEIESILFPDGENILIYFGSATGRDGVHGATMSSSEFSAGGATLKPTVQVGDPFAEKVLLEATLSIIEKKLAIGLQDMGAAGLTSSSVEMAGRSGCGVAIDLAKVPQRASNMQAWEILLSESQERMLCAVKPENLNAVLEELKKFNLSYAEIGKVNRTGLFVCLFDKQIVTATPIPILIDDVPRYDLPIQDRESYLKNHDVLNNETVENIWIGSTTKSKPSLSLNAVHLDAHNDILSNISLENLIEKYPNLIDNLFTHPANAKRSAVYHNYCSTVQGNTVAGCGAMQTASAGIVRLPKFAQEKDINNLETKTGIAVAGGCEERWVEMNPYQGSALSALKVARKIIASNGVPLAMTDCLNFGSPRSPEVMRQLSDAVDGINLVAKEFHIPIVSGNVSLNNQTSGHPIPPTPMLGIVGRIDDVTKVPLLSLPALYFEKAEHKTVFLVQLADKNALELSSYEASQTAWILGKKNSHCPQLNLTSEQNLWKQVLTRIQELKPKLCFPVGHGGLLGSLISCSLRSECEIELSENLWKMSSQDLFSEGNMGFIFGFEHKENAEKFIQLTSNHFKAEYLAALKPVGSSIPKTVFDYKTVFKLYSNSLKRFFDTLSCEYKEK